MRLFSILLVVMMMAAGGWAQDISWERTTEPKAEPITVFHSPHAVNLETATTIDAMNMEFQIYHRFLPPLSEGYDSFWGLDGPVRMRLGLGYGVTDRLTVTLARSNYQGNIDLKAKYRVWERRFGEVPVMAAVQAGGAWNTNVFGRDDGDDRNFQYYGQVILNTKIRDKFAFGVVPVYLYNGDIMNDPYRDSFILGLYGQYYFLSRFSVLAEWTGVLDGYQQQYDNYTLAFEIQTAGHFFKIMVSNNTTLNPSRIGQAEQIVLLDQQKDQGEHQSAADGPGAFVGAVTCRSHS